MSRYHFIGIGGIGLSALAKILLQRGSRVQGSDAAVSYVTEDLQASGAQIFSHHSAAHVAPSMTVVYGSAIKEEHPEYQAALEHQLPLFHRAELLAELMKGSRALLVTGTHGKTSTSALLTHLLLTAGLDPSYAVGGTLIQQNSNGGYGKGEYFVAESDESDGSFLKSPSFGAIITNLEKDHMDHWKTEEALLQGFKTFAQQVSSPKHLFWCADDANLTSLKLPGFSYGFATSADLRILKWSQETWTLNFDLAFEGGIYSKIEIPLLGKHNVANAAAVFGMGVRLGLEESVIRKAFSSFGGVKRRMEKKGEKLGVMLYDDYGHHPTEIAVTLKALKKAVGERRLIIAFQPHRYSRTQDCWNEFLKVFEEADELVLTDIYGAGEKAIPGITGERLFEAVREKSHVNCRFVRRDKMADFFSGFLRPHDVVVTMGAGDITYLASEILEKPISPIKMALISGGKSTEHEVAHCSANVLMGAIHREFYEIQHFKICKQGKWFLNENELPLSEVVTALQKSTICFPVLHGPYCEDGMIQGFLETIGVPYVGCDYRTGPVAMDKAWTKRIALTHGVAIAPFLKFYSHEWETQRERCLQEILKKFKFPFFVKPAHLGSTFGVHRIKSQAQLETALDEVCTFDYKFLVEEEVIGREMEFGFLGNHEVVVTDPAEVIIQGEELYTYEGKYGANSAPAAIKVPLSPEVLAAGRKAAERVYKALDCSGLARIDFFLKSDGTWVLNEVNPMPGCTPTSVYPKFWPAEGISLTTVVDRIVISGFHRKRYQERRLMPKEAQKQEDRSALEELAQVTQEQTLQTT